MNLKDLEYVPSYTLSLTSALHRIQRTRARPRSVAIGPLRTPPRGLLTCRFDLHDAEVGYFAESPEAAAFEAIFRREATAVAVSMLIKRTLLALQVVKPLVLLDLRPHAPGWPVLQSLRYGATQELALDARNSGFAGVVYRSAQQYGSDCFAVFGEALRGLKLTSKATLVHPTTGALHRVGAYAARRSGILLVP